jgi:hypothetical protein
MAIAKATMTKHSVPLTITRSAPEVDPLAVVAVAAGVAVAMAPTPPVTGPLSGSCEIRKNQQDVLIGNSTKWLLTRVSELPIFSAAAWNAWNVLPVDGALIDLQLNAERAHWTPLKSLTQPYPFHNEGLVYNGTRWAPRRL